MARPFLRCAVFVLLAALLLALPAAAAPAAGKARSGASFFTTIWDFLASLLDEGCGIDPNGCTAAAAPQEAGCGIDPNGCTAAQSPPPDHTDAGCLIDPNGGCAK